MDTGENTNPSHKGLFWEYPSVDVNGLKLELYPYGKYNSAII